MLGASALCPGVPGGAGVEVLAPSVLRTIHTEVDPNVDTTNPTIAIQYIQERSQGQNENELETDVLVAWERSLDRSDQVDGVVVTLELDGTVGTARQLIPETQASGGPILTRIPCRVRLVMLQNPNWQRPISVRSWRGWTMITFDGNSDSSIFILSRYRNTLPGPYVMSEFERNDASGTRVESNGRLAAVAFDGANGRWLSSACTLTSPGPKLVWPRPRQTIVQFNRSTFA